MCCHAEYGDACNEFRVSERDEHEQVHCFDVPFIESLKGLELLVCGAAAPPVPAGIVVAIRSHTVRWDYRELLSSGKGVITVSM